MAAYIVRRLLGLIPVLFGITLVVFLRMQLIPGDVAQAMLGLDRGSAGRRQSARGSR
jgi:peptide/nickel transport system permease protein